MQRFKRNAAILLAAAIVGSLFFLVVGHDGDRTQGMASASGSDLRQDSSIDLKASTLAADGKSVRDMIAFREKLLRNLHRVRMLDPTMSDEELAAFENELVNAAEFDERARKMMIDELHKAFAQRRPSDIYLLERVLIGSAPGQHALTDTYIDMVLKQSDGSDFYALQGLKNLQMYLTEENMQVMFDKAAGQLDRYDSFARYSPAMTFAAQAMKEGRYKPSTAQRNALLSSIERRQAVARDQQEQFFIAQSLIWMAEPSERAALVERMLRQYPNRGTFAAVLESLDIGDFEPDARLMSSLENIARRLSEQRTG